MKIDLPPCSPNKVYVDVIAQFHKEGHIRIKPLFFTWEDGRHYKIEDILDITNDASLKAGGIGIRYTCQVYGKQTYLWLEDDLWFMERK